MDVKLNNPLMGTETARLRMHRYSYCIVKLNNPLMGTETLLYKFHQAVFYEEHVKLNNPLMGTETHLARLCLIYLAF